MLGERGTYGSRLPNLFFQDLIRSLLVKNPLKRLGMGLKGMEELKAHPWFKGFNWQALKTGQMPAPYVPRILNPEDTHNFHKARAWSAPLRRRYPLVPPRPSC